MAKRAILILAALLMVFTGAAAEKATNLNNGLMLTCPDDWEINNFTWTKGDEMLLVYPADLTAAAVDISAVDKHDLLTSFGSQFRISDLDDFQSYYPLNGFYVTTAAGTMESVPCQIALLLNETSLCVLAYFDLSGGGSQRDILDFVDWFSPAAGGAAGGTAASETAAQIRKEGNRYYLDKVPLTLDLSEDEFDIVYLGITEDSESVRRSPYSLEQINAVLSAGITTDMVIWRTGTDGLPDRAPSVRIRIKDQKYEGIDFRVLSESALKETCDALFVSMAQDGQYQMETVNGIPYARFRFNAGNEIRYATILNGDIIYVFLKYPDGLTEDSEAMLRTVLENLKTVE